jgi:hypothetical protein
MNLMMPDTYKRILIMLILILLYCLFNFCLLHVKQLHFQVIELSDYRAQLYDYLKHRMMAIAPNTTALVGELVGARLISHAGKDYGKSILLHVYAAFIISDTQSSLNSLVKCQLIYQEL